MSQGRKDAPEPSLFVECTRVYDHIPKRHFYEQLNGLLDLGFVRELTRPLYAPKLGRPSLDPEVFVKCMLIGFFENIIYDTELEYRLADSLTFRKFLGYGLEERTPDESTLRKTRQRMPEELFRAVFGYVLDVCGKHGLLKGRALGTDSTLVDANASMDSLCHRELGCTYEEYMLALRRQDAPEASLSEARNADKDREGKASNRDWESPTDPESRVMQHSDKHTHLSWKVDASVDLETGAIVSVGADQANVSDQSDFLERVDEAVEALEERGYSPEVVVADKGHHSGENLAGLEQRGLVGLVSSPHRKQGAEGFRREDFRYDAEGDTLECPMGERMMRVDRRDEHRRQYRAPGRACQSCPHFGICTTNRRGRTVSVSVYEDLVKANRVRVHSEAALPLLQIRRQRGERPFGYFKQFGGLRRMSGRGLNFAVKKALMAGAAWNLLLVIKKLLRGLPSDRLYTAMWLSWALLERICRPWGAPDDGKPHRRLETNKNPISSPTPLQLGRYGYLSGGC